LSVGAAAEASQVPLGTARRWALSPRVVAATRHEQDARLEAISRQVAGLAGLAVAVLGQVLQDGGLSAGIRVRAAVAVLEQFVRLHEYAMLAGRVEALERQLGGEYVATNQETGVAGSD
jgi:hypothetical protein